MENISSRIDILGITEGSFKTRLSQERLPRCPRRQKRARMPLEPDL
jgi:hypothetical protein